jgi:hypothetical protein
MIELTEQQIQALENPQATPPQVVNPRTKETLSYFEPTNTSA